VRLAKYQQKWLAFLKRKIHCVSSLFVFSIQIFYFSFKFAWFHPPFIKWGEESREIEEKFNLIKLSFIY